MKEFFSFPVRQNLKILRNGNNRIQINRLSDLIGGLSLHARAAYKI